MQKSKKTSSVIMITSNGMSKAENGLSHKLLLNYLNLLIEENLLPNAILFYGEGVKTVVENSPFLESLDKLQQQNVKLIACKTCLNHYNLQDKLKVGSLGTMMDIVHYQWNVDKVITL
jgi:hypothetical protein